jgi:hypothetical protein
VAAGAAAGGGGGAFDVAAVVAGVLRVVLFQFTHKDAIDKDLHGAREAAGDAYLDTNTDMVVVN